uniref:DPH-type MB domain-containing protein n=1 Tax=Naja naja TaxID=35670 RepID=A0A8C6Y536_NAJNA
MSVFHDEVEIEDFEYDEDTETYSYPCPCGDRFLITREDLENGEDVATCPSCSLIVKVIYDKIISLFHFGRREEEVSASQFSLQQTTRCEQDLNKKDPTVQVETYRGASDDTSLNGIRLFCSTEQTNNIMYTVESEPGEYGHWSGVRWCPRNGILRSFQLKVEPEQGAGDDTAVNNIRFRCSNGLQLEEAGGPFGEYSEWSTPCERGGICGLQTKQEPYQGIFIDDTALNDVRFFCCE